jgi:hypothetical protein
MLDRLEKYCINNDYYKADIIRSAIENYLTNKSNKLIENTQWR